MITFVNDPLFEKCIEKDTNYKNFKYPYITTIKNTPRIMKKINKTEADGTRSIAYTSNQKTLLTICANGENFNQYKMLARKENEKDLFIFANDFANFDTTYYVVAFPYNGVMKPLKEPGQNYRILSGKILHSVTDSVNWNGEKYWKVLYLVICPNTAFLTPNNRSFRKFIPIVFESFGLAEDTENGKMCTYESMTLEMKPNGKFSARWKRELVPPVDMKQYTSQPIFEEYAFPSKKEKIGKTEFSKKNETPQKSKKKIIDSNVADLEESSSKLKKNIEKDRDEERRAKSHITHGYNEKLLQSDESFEDFNKQTSKNVSHMESRQKDREEIESQSDTEKTRKEDSFETEDPNLNMHLIPTTEPIDGVGTKLDLMIKEALKNTPTTGKQMRYNKKSKKRK